MALYLMTSPNSNMLGLFSQPILYMAHETGLGQEGTLKGLKACIEVGFCCYDEDTEMVWVYEMAKYQIASELKPSDLRCKGVQKDYDALPDNPFLAAFFDRYSKPFHMDKQRGSQVPCETLSSQEQEQEQEQAQEQDSFSLRSKESAGKPASTRPKREETILKTYLDACKAAGKKPLPADHSVRDYCRDAGISEEMLQVAWVVFREDHTTGTSKGKKKKDWPGHFANAVKGCWAKLWWTDGATVAWTSRGQQEKAVLDARAKARETAHEPA
ncbi:MAG: hypothetical protein V4730_11880 [Pseudomonadota bacterium]